jgi:thiol-disulfide isomerase/thioredoxin
VNWENIRASTCLCQISPSITSWLFLVFLACTIWLSPAVSARSFDRQTSALAQSPKAQLLFFTARWCAPCRKLKPYISKICDQNKTSVQLIEIDYDAAPVLVKEYAVDSLPTMILLDSSGMLLMRINESSEEALKALSSEIRRLAKTKRTREKDHVEPSDFPSSH